MNIGIVMYYVEQKSKHEALGWRRVPFAEHKTRAYCDGFVDAFDSLYPSDPMRIVKVEKDGSAKVVRETRGHGKVHTN